HCDWARSRSRNLDRGKVRNRPCEGEQWRRSRRVGRKAVVKTNSSRGRLQPIDNFRADREWAAPPSRNQRYTHHRISRNCIYPDAPRTSSRPEESVRTSPRVVTCLPNFGSAGKLANL